MGTRGLTGFRAGGKEFLAYNHSDSYPTYLGKRILQYVRDNDVSPLKDRASEITLVGTDDAVTLPLLEKAWPFLNIEDSTPQKYFKKEKPTWYSAMRDMQGELDPWVQGLPVWPDYSGFQFSSSCEWAYIVNLDDGVLEIYTGHWSGPEDKNGYYKKQKPNGRYAVKDDEGDYGILLVEAIPLTQFKGLTDDAIDKYCKRLYARY